MDEDKNFISGHYDMDSKRTESDGLEIYDLCKVLSEEYKNQHINNEDYTEKDPNTIRKLFINGDKSGLIDKLNKLFSFDLQSIAGNDKDEKFNMLKLLKLLYYIEKDGKPKNSKAKRKKRIIKREKEKLDKFRICITDILAKPRLDNIPTKYSDKSEYGEIFQKMYESVVKCVCGSLENDKKYEELSYINLKWEKLVDLLYNNVFDDYALENQEEAFDHLNEYLEFITHINSLIADFKPETVPNREGVLETFHNILISHRLLCYEVDRININYQMIWEDAPSDEYIKKFRDLEKTSIPKIFFPIIQQYCSRKDINDLDCVKETRNVFNLIANSKEYKEGNMILTINNILKFISDEFILDDIEFKKEGDSYYPVNNLVKLTLNDDIYKIIYWEEDLDKAINDLVHIISDNKNVSEEDIEKAINYLKDIKSVNKVHKKVDSDNAFNYLRRITLGYDKIFDEEDFYNEIKNSEHTTSNGKVLKAKDLRKAISYLKYITSEDNKIFEEEDFYNAINNYVYIKSDGKVCKKEDFYREIKNSEYTTYNGKAHKNKDLYKAINYLKLFISNGKEFKEEDIINEINNFLYFISYGKGFKDEDLESYEFAFKHLDTVLKWWDNNYDDADNSVDVSTEHFVTSMQELISTYENRHDDNYKFTNDFFGYKNSRKTFMSAVKKGNKADAVMTQAWIKNLENRMCINFGGRELIKLKRKIEDQIFKIKSFIFSYQNFEDLKFVNELIFLYILNHLIGSENIYEHRVKISEGISNITKNMMINIDFIWFNHEVCIYDLHKEVLLFGYKSEFNEDMIDAKIMNDLADQIREIIEKGNSNINEELTCHIKKPIDFVFKGHLLGSNGKYYVIYTNFLYEHMFFWFENGYPEKFKNLGLKNLIIDIIDNSEEYEVNNRHLLGLTYKE